MKHKPNLRLPERNEKCERRKSLTRYATLLAVLIASAIGRNAHAQAIGDYRSAASGNWNAAAIWETYTGILWIGALTPPVSANGVITILNGHSVTNTAAVNVDEIIVETGALMVVNAGVTVTLNNGTGTDLDISGTLQINGNGLISGGSGTSLQLQPAANLIIGSNAGIAAAGGTGNIQTAIRGFSTSANYTYAGTAAQTTGTGLPATVNDLTIANSAGVNLTAATAVNGTLTLNNGAFAIGNNLLTINGALSVASGTLTGGANSDIAIGGSGASLTLPAVSSGLRNLTLNRANGAVLSAPLNLSTALTLTDGPLDNSSNNLILASGATITRADGSLAAAPTFGASANVTYTGTAALTPGLEMPAGATVLNNLTVGNTGGFTLTGNLTVNGNVIIGSGATLDVTASDYSLDVKGNWSNNGGTFTPHTGSVAFNGTAAQAINGSATSQTFHNLTINKSAQTLSVSGSTTTLTVNDLTQTAGGFTPPATLNVLGNFTHTAGTFTAGANFNLAGDWTRNGGTFTAGSGTVTFNGAAAQSLGGSATTAFFKLNNNKSADTLTAAADFSVSSTFTNLAGIFDASSRTITLSGSGTPLAITGGTFNPATSTILYTSTSGANVAGGLTYHNLTVNSSGDTFTAAADMTIANTLTIAVGTTFNASSRTITLSASGTPLVITGTFTPATSTIVCTSATGADISAATYNNLTINGTGTFALGGPVTVGGNLTLTSGDLSIGANTLTVNGLISTTAGTLTGGANANITIGGAGASTTLPAVILNSLIVNRANGLAIASGVNVNGTLTLTAGAVTSAANLTLGNGATISRQSGSLSAAPVFGTTVNLIYTGTANLFTGPEVPSGPAALNNFTDNNTSTLTLGSPLIVNGDLTIAASAVLAVGTTNNPITMRGNWLNNGGTLTAGAGTVTVDGAGAQNIGGTAATTFNNLVINKASGTATAGANHTISTGLTIQAGTFDASTRTITLSGSSAPFVVAGTFIPSTSTILYNGAGAVNIAGGITYYNLTVNNGGETYIPNADLTVANVLNIQGGTFNASSRTITLSGAGTPLVIGGALTIGTSTFAYASTTGASITATTFNNLTVAGTGNFTLGGATAVNGTLTLTSGALVIGANTLTLNGDIVQTGGTLTGGASANVTIGGTGASTTLPAVTLNNLTINRANGLAIGSGVTVNGVVTLTSGTVTDAGNLALGNSATISRSLGSLSGAPGFGTAVNVAFTGATGVSTGPEIPANPATLNNLTNSNTGGVSLSGDTTVNGRLALQSGTVSIGANTLTLNGPVSGAGTLTGGAAANIIFSGGGAATILPSVTLNNLTINRATGISMNGAVTVGGTLALDSGAFAIGANILTINGNITTTGGTLTGGATADLIVGGTGASTTLPAVTSGLRNVTLNRANGLTLGGALTISTALTLTSGQLNNGANLTLGNGATVSRADGSLLTAPTFGTTVNLSYAGSSATTSGLEIPLGATTLNNLVMNNSGGLTLASSPTVNGTLTLTSGKISTGANQINLTTASIVSGGSSASYVNGSVQRAYNTGGQSFTYPIGDNLVYAPVALASIQVTTAGSLKVTTTAGEQPNISTSGIDATQDVNRYWTFTPSGIGASSYNATFNFVVGDLDGGANTAAFIVRRYNGGWSATTIGTRTATSAQATGLTSFSDFAIGEQLIDHYLVTASSPQTVGIAFNTTVTAQDILNQTVVADNTTVVTLTNTGSGQFDSDGNTIFGDNTKALTSGTFTISTKDNVAETIDIVATDANGKTGTAAAIVVGNGVGSFRSSASGYWTNISIWETNNGVAWAAATNSPTSTAGIILLQNGSSITNTTAITVDQVLVDTGASLVIPAGITLTLANGAGTDLEVAGSLLWEGTGLVTGGSGTAFQLQPAAILGIGSAGGIATSGAVGSIRSATRAFHTNANYIYLGTTAQATGNGLPAVVNNLSIANSAGVALSAETTVAGTLALDAGALSIGANTLGVNGPVAIGSGSLTGGANSSVSVGGAGASTALPGVSLLNLSLNRASGIAIAGNVTVNGALTLTSGKISTGANQINLGNAAMVAGASGANYVVGKVQKSFPTGNGQAFSFPIGDANGFMPVALASMNVPTAGSVLAGSTAGEHPNLAGSGINAVRGVNRYWTLTGTGIVATNYSATFNFVATDVDAGAVPAVFAASRFNGSWSSLTVGSRTATSIQVTGVNGFSDFAVGELTSKLVFVQQPTDSPANTAVAPAITVQLQDAANNNVAAPGVAVVMSLDSGAGNANGTRTNFTDANGLASFSDLSMDVGGVKTLAASAAGLTGAVSSSFTVTSAAPPPVISQQPTNLSVTVGDTAALMVSATGTGPLAYQWRLFGTNILADGAHFAGANSDTLAITNVSRYHAGEYSVVVANEGGAVTSAVASLTVDLPPGVLFMDDFVRIVLPGAVSPWSVYSGNWAVSAGDVLVGGTNPLSTYGFAHLNKSWGDFSVEARLQLPAGAFGGGIGGRLDPNVGSHYAAWIYPEGSAGGSNVLKLVKFLDWYDFTIIAQTNLAAVGTSPHLVKLTFVGDSIHVSFDGVTIVETTDASYAAGSIVTGFWTEGVGYATGVDDVRVATVNTAPSLPVIDEQLVVELDTLMVTNAASDLDLPVNGLTYELLVAPANASIDGNGVISFTPNESQGGTTNTIATRVIDDGSPALAATNTFTVVVLEGDSAPQLPGISQQTVAEGSLLSVNSAATDTDMPTNTLNYSLVNPPLGASVDGSGLISWTPTEAQGPNTNDIIVVVDDGTVSVTNTFSVIVAEVNVAPQLPGIGQQTVAEGSLLSVNSAATDSDVPANTLNYSLVNSPSGASVDGSGLISWTPTEAQGPITNDIFVVVSDGTVSVTNTFSVIVTEVNVAPQLPGIGQQMVAEGSLLSVNSVATDSDVPANTLNYSLVNPPSGASIDSVGLVSWTPTEAQGPSTNDIVVVVSDGTVNVTNMFSVIVTEVNVAPQLPGIGQQMAAEGSLLSVNSVATDMDMPTNTLNYSLVNPPSGASVDGSGLISWTPTEAQGPNTNDIIVVVDDGMVSVTNTFSVIVTEVNVAPQLPGIGQQTVAEGSLLTVNSAATDTDMPTNTLNYSLVNPPSGASVDGSGLISWTPTEAQGPGTNDIIVVVDDSTVSVTNTFSVIVTEVNEPPQLPTQSDQAVDVLIPLNVNNAATDSDLPANPLSYSLLNPPVGANIDSNGLITWTPSIAQGGTTNTITTVVNDGLANATNSFEVIVTVVPQPEIIVMNLTNGVAVVTWTSVAGHNYRLQYKEDLTAGAWTDVTPDVPATGAQTTGTDNVGSAPMRFYRVTLAP